MYYTQILLKIHRFLRFVIIAKDYNSTYAISVKKIYAKSI